MKNHPLKIFSIAQKIFVNIYNIVQKYKFKVQILLLNSKIYGSSKFQKT